MTASRSSTAASSSPAGIASDEINVGGAKASASAVRDVLQAHPAVAWASVRGRKAPIVGTHRDRRRRARPARRPRARADVVVRGPAPRLRRAPSHAVARPDPDQGDPEERCLTRPNPSAPQRCVVVSGGLARARPRHRRGHPRPGREGRRLRAHASPPSSRPWPRRNPDRVVAASVDVTDVKAITAFLKEAESRLGPIDALVNNAAIGPGQPARAHLAGADRQDHRDQPHGAAAADPRGAAADHGQGQPRPHRHGDLGLRPARLLRPGGVLGDQGWARQRHADAGPRDARTGARQQRRAGLLRLRDALGARPDPARHDHPAHAVGPSRRTRQHRAGGATRCCSRTPTSTARCITVDGGNSI